MSNGSRSDNRIRRALAALAFALALVVSQLPAAPLALAAQTGEVTITAQQEAHSYAAYQLFAGTVNDDGTMSELSWEGCMSSAFYAALGAFETAQDAALWVQGQADADSTGAFPVKLSRLALELAPDAATQTFSTGETVTLSAGYWLFVSEDAQPVLATVGAEAVNVSEKSTVPGIEKQVGEVAADGSVTYGQAADASANTNVPYTLTGTLPSNYAAFDSYEYAFVDEMDAALTADAASVSAQLEKADGTVASIAASAVTATFSNQTLTVSLGDLKQSVPDAAYGDKIVVSYTAQLSAGAATLGLKAGNLNTARLRYTRSPSYDATGLSAPATARVYTYALRLVKVSRADEATKLKGAVFALENADGKFLAGDGTWVSKRADAQHKTDAKGEIEFAGLDAGDYTLVELEAPAGYDKIDGEIAVTVSADIAAATLSASTSPKKVAEVTGAQANAGIVQVTVKDPPTASSGDDNNNNHAADTGDQLRGILLAAGVAAAALVVFCLAFFARRRRRDDDAHARE